MSKKLLFPLVLLLTSAGAAHAQTALTAIPPALTGSVTNVYYNDLAYNDKDGVYLQILGYPDIWGRFVTADGQPLGTAPFLIANVTAADNSPRVAYSAGSSDNVFMVVFSTELNVQQMYTRLVRYTPDGPVMSDIQPVVNVPGTINNAGGIAFNPFKRQFFITWESTIYGQWEVLGQLWQLSGTATTPSVAPATGILNVTQANTGQGTPNVAYDWKHDRYMVVYRGEHPDTPLILGSWGRIVSFDAANAMSLSPVITLTSGNGEPGEQNVTYMPESDEFLTFWTDITRVRDLSGRIIGHGGVPTTGVLPLLVTSSNEGAADAEYNPYTRTILLAAMRDLAPGFVQGVELTAGGAAFRYFQASTAAPVPGTESFFPHVAVGHNGRFGLGYMNNYLNVWFELLQGQTQLGGHFITPPAPPCTSTLSTTSITTEGLGGTASVGVTGSCTWTASSGSSWISVTSGASGTGNGTVGLAFARNDTGLTRTGTVTIADQRVTVQQPAFLARAAVHDITGDGLSDLMWHHELTGRVAVWAVNGPNVINTFYLNAPPVDLSWRVVGTGDINGDGYADVLWRNTNGRVAAWLVRGSTVLSTRYVMVAVDPAATPVPVLEPDLNWELRGVGDLNGDGKADLIWQHATNGGLATWLMNGVNITNWGYLTVSHQTDLNWKIAGAGDINQDGKADILWQHQGTGALAAWLMNGSRVGTQSRLSASQPDLTWKVQGVGDVNGDGYADLLWQKTDGTLIGVWYLRSFTVTEMHGFPVWSGDVNWKLVGPG